MVKMYFAEDRETKYVGFDQLLDYSEAEYERDRDARVEIVWVLLYPHTYPSPHRWVAINVTCECYVI